MDLIHEDRREDRRYPIELEMRYKAIGRGAVGLQGQGRTVNMSSGGILFQGDQDLPVGCSVELSIHWPVMLHNTCPLTLLVVGRVVRCENNRIAVKTNRYEFLTRPIRNSQTGPGNGGKTWIA